MPYRMELRWVRSSSPYDGGKPPSSICFRHALAYFFGSLPDIQPSVHRAVYYTRADVSRDLHFGAMRGFSWRQRVWICSLFVDSENRVVRSSQHASMPRIHVIRRPLLLQQFASSLLFTPHLSMRVLHESIAIPSPRRQHLGRPGKRGKAVEVGLLARHEAPPSGQIWTPLMSEMQLNLCIYRRIGCHMLL